MKIRNIVQQIITESVQFGAKEKAEIMQHYADDIFVGFEVEMHLQEAYGPEAALRDEYDFLSMEDFRSSTEFFDAANDYYDFRMEDALTELASETESPLDAINDFPNKANEVIRFLKMNSQILMDAAEMVRFGEYHLLNETVELDKIKELGKLVASTDLMADIDELESDTESLIFALDEFNTSFGDLIESIDTEELFESNVVLSSGFGWVGYYKNLMFMKDFFKDAKTLHDKLFDVGYDVIIKDTDDLYFSRFFNWIEESRRGKFPLELAEFMEFFGELSDLNVENAITWKSKTDFAEQLDDSDVMEIVDGRFRIFDGSPYFDAEDYVREIENLIEGSDDNHFRANVTHVVEDSSVAGGGEIVSDVMDLDRSILWLYEALKFVERYGHTSSDTGLHINMSISNQSSSFVVDPLRLLLLMDPKYITDEFEVRNSNVQDMLRNFRRAATLEHAAFVYTSNGVEGLIDFSRNLIHNQEKSFQINFGNMYGGKHMNMTQGRERRIEFRYPGGSGYEDEFDKIEHHIMRMAHMLMILFNGEYKQRDFLQDLIRLWNRVAEEVLNVSFDSVVSEYRKHGTIEGLTGDRTVAGFDNFRRRY